MKLELRGVTKRFGSFAANESVDLTILPGEIHCILGENGAGKSTLMNLAYGLYEPDEGDILIDGVPVHFAGPRDAMRAGIGMVHQHFMLVPVFTVAENIALGNEPRGKLGLLDTEAADREVIEISERFGFHMNPSDIVANLPVGVQQRVEIVKALIHDAQVLILDEPTAVLTPQETDELIEIMLQLRAAGTAIVFITHKLREVKAVADRITVMRHGRVVGHATSESSEADLAELMVGRSVNLRTDKPPAQTGGVGLVVEGLTVTDDLGQKLVDNVAFEIHKGEILAVAGVQGNGQTELTEALVGLRPVRFGRIELDGQPLQDLGVRRRLQAGIGYVPEDRKNDGIIADFSIVKNLILDLHDKKPFAVWGTMLSGPIRDNAARATKEFDIRASASSVPAGRLSGGNQQKIVLARELTRDLRLFIASQPTRGLDVGSIEFVHARILRERAEGVPVLIVSTELDEVLTLADRIAVMYRGRIVGIVPADTPRPVLGMMMAGASADEAWEQLHD